ncbi:MAG: class I SAM-dependent methyltransferase [Zoogloeaceae bacterium]|jgi:hypothetical protein|nr:class I SAM-dependent methyltransferase [Zoogloeaceae bacterium]
MTLFRHLARQCAVEAAAVFLVFSIFWPFYFLRVTEWRWPVVCAACGTLAFLIARVSRQPWWWQVIHLAFVPALWAGLQLAISPLWYLGGFLVLLLVFRGAASGRIPLYPSGARTTPQLACLLPDKAATLDIGAGIGSLLLPLSRQRPDLLLSGIDNAPLPWLIGLIRVHKIGIRWLWGDFWRHPLAPYQAVYCFLSPTPMSALWRKACREMWPGCLFVSKAFPVPGIIPECICRDPEDTAERDTLYVYRIPARNREGDPENILRGNEYKPRGEA